MKIEISDRHWHAIMGALRMQEDNHKRNDFKALVIEIQEIRSYFNDAMIDKNLPVG